MYKCKFFLNFYTDVRNSNLAAEYALAGTTFVTDFNNASIPGRYRVYNASGSAAHGPYAGAVGGYVDILTDGDTTVTGTKVYQILHDHNGDAYIRINIAGTSYGTWDRFAQLSDLAVAIGETSNITSASFTGKIIWQNLGRLTTLSFELTTKKELASGATYELISIVEGIPSKKANCVLMTSDGKPYYCYSSPDGKFYVANYTGAAIPANKVLYGQIAFISV